MKTTAIREKLHDYINIADDEKIKAIYTLVEEQILLTYDWANDEKFVAELDERYRRYEEGIDKGVTIEGLEASIELRQAHRFNL